MNENEKVLAMELWKDAFSAGKFAQARCAELADEYTRLEVQIAAIILAFIGVLVDKMPTGYSFGALFSKGLFTFVLVMIMASLIVGLLHIKRKEWWWHNHVVSRAARRTVWGKTLTEDGSFQMAKSFQSGTDMGSDNVSASPTWSWVLQTVLLALGVGGLFVLQLAFIFGR